MANRSDITPEVCRQLLRYEPATGKLYWLARPREMFVSQRSFSTWNANFAGKEALTALSRGYHVGAIHSVMMKAHRVAYAIYHGVWPDVIDHIDGDPGNNRIENLRSSSQADNLRNLSIRSDNTTGANGVYRAGRKWTAQITVGGKGRHIGTFDTFEEATEEAQKARNDAGFHANHGRRT